jgi:hypothetical protein
MRLIMIEAAGEESEQGGHGLSRGGQRECLGSIWHCILWRTSQTQCHPGTVVYQG